MTTSRSTSVALLSAALLALPGSARWDAAGHRPVAAIAWEHMTPRARARAVALLLHGPGLANLAALRPAEGSEAARDRALFLNAATWADLVRNRDQAWHVYHHATWHYADFYWDAENGQPQDIPDTGPDSLNAAERIVALGGPRSPPAEPLPKGDEGGNRFHLDDNHNLHAYWDRILDATIAPDLGEDSIAYASRVARQIEGTHPGASPPAPAAQPDALGWAREGLRLAQTVAYSGVSRGRAPSAAYQAAALQVAEGRIAQAGYRLAALLNAALE